MRRNIVKVIEAFREHRAAVGDGKRTCSTDGTTVYSYEMPIAQRRGDGTIEVCKTGPTVTTRSQISALHLAFPEAARVEVICRKYVFVRIER